MSLPPLNALRAFEAVARTGSFKAAAERLCVTQPAISHQVRHLEAWIGASLFDRSERRPRLTPRGETLSRELNLAFESIDSACARAKPEMRADCLVVAAIPSVAICWLIPRLPSLRQRFANLPLRIVYAHHGESIDFTEVDLAFVFSDATPVGSGFESNVFLPGASIPVCSPTLVNRFVGSAFRAEDLLKIELLHDTDESGWLEWFGKAQLDRPKRLTGATFEDFNLLRIAALSGQGVALCSRAMIKDDLAAGRLVQLSEVEVLETFRYYITRSNALRRTAIIEAREKFLSWLEDEKRAEMDVKLPAALWS